MKILLIVLAAVLAAVLGGLGYLGAFKPVEIQERSAGPYQFVYVQEASTDFGKVGKHTEALGKRLEEAGFVNRKPAQVYYPVSQGIQNQIGFIVDRPVTRDVLGTDMFFRIVPVETYMTVRFPYRMPLSFVVAHLRLEGMFKDYRKAKGYAETSAFVMLEGDKILYLQPIQGG